MRDWELPIYAYVVVCGPLDNLNAFHVVINKIDHQCKNLLKAIDNCYQCLKALGSFPKICSHVRAFIERLIYRIKSKNHCFSDVNLPVAAIEEKLKTNNTNLSHE